ncbi:hypothetical protein [Phenylobacterium sp.]|uniref:hypothetical protein n=1 Tax=Phenylobacterium sp. TaxID=1871053 RepID=UPI002D160FC5|nr:hypothetical protein [Phenylobacterium sp.]HLZ76099.1 hypothetical protein [Phenylobacterium sp.]
MIGAIFSTAVLLLLQAAPEAAAPASTPVSAPTAAPATHAVSPVTVTSGRKASAPDPAEMICHKEPVIGSLFPKEVCARRDEIAERRRVDQATTRAAQAQRPWKDPGG